LIGIPNRARIAGLPDGANSPLMAHEEETDEEEREANEEEDDEPV
jgi:hypothetical protein